MFCVYLGIGSPSAQAPPDALADVGPLRHAEELRSSDVNRSPSENCTSERDRGPRASAERAVREPSRETAGSRGRHHAPEIEQQRATVIAGGQAAREPRQEEREVQP